MKITTARVVATVAILAVLGAAVASTTFVSSEEAAQAAPEAFDPAAFAADNFDELVVAPIDERAIDLAELQRALADGADESEFGQAPGAASSYSFPVTFTGVAGEVEGSGLPVDVEGLPDDIVVEVQVGPAITGTALRDVSGEIAFGQFTNQLEFQQAGTGLNELVKSTVLADVDPASLAGSTITVSGAFTRVNPSFVSVVPISIEVGE